MEVASSSLPRDSFALCLDYLQMYEDMPEVPARSPRRPKGISTVFPLISNPTNNRQNLGLNCNEYSSYSSHSSQYTTSNNRVSVSSSLFSEENEPRQDTQPLDNSMVDLFLEEITGEDEICCVDSVVTIVKSHDQWDPKKVAIVATR